MRPIPGLAGFLMSRDRGMREDESALQQQQVAMNLQGMMQKRKQEAAQLAQQEAMRQALAQNDGDPEKAIELALRSGNTAAAAQLAPLAKMRAEAREREQTTAGMRELLAPQPAPQQNPMVPGPGASVMAGSGTPPPQMAMPNPTEQRLKHLDALAVRYANNPSMLRMIEGEKGKITEQSRRAPPTRNRYDGKNVIQEELTPEGWKQIGSGPRFPEPSAINVYSGSLTKAEDAQGNPVFVQPSTREGVDPRVIRGIKPPKPTPTGASAEQGLSPENAGKVAMGQQAVEGIGTARGIIFDKDGNLNRTLVGAINLPIVAGLPGNSQARIARSALRNAVEAKLRIETGAAATESEVERTLARFMPTVADTKESAKFKLDELEKFFKSSLSMTKKPTVAAPSATPPTNDPLGIR